MGKAVKKFFVRRSSFLVLGSSLLVICLSGIRAIAANAEPSSKNQEQVAAIFRPEAGKFPPIEKSVSYEGELVFVDHANRRGSIRVKAGSDVLYRNAPHPFAMLPYGIVRYHGAAADLRDIPIGTMLHVSAFLPPDPNTSAVPVVKNATVEHPAENHVILLEDEPSYCQRTGKTWKLKEIDLQKIQGMVIASLEPKEGSDSKAAEQKLTLNAATRIWRGRESLTIADLIAEGIWSASGKKSLGGQAVRLGLTWLPAGTWENRVEHQFHISDIWLDDLAMQRSAQQQASQHQTLIRTRWLSGWVDTVEYGKFGHATVTATLFGDMDATLFADLTPGSMMIMNPATNTLKHMGDSYGNAHMASKGTILDIIKASGVSPTGSSGVQVRFETDLIIEGIRPSRVVRVRPASWTDVAVPREEYLGVGAQHEDRFPSPAIFPKY